MKIRIIQLITLISLLPSFSGCGNNNRDTMEHEANTTQPSSADGSLFLPENITLFFGHQSVGENIVTGLTELIETGASGSFTITDTKQPDGPGFFHSKIGENRDPLKKMDEFKQILMADSGANINIAFMKLCYVDITADTDIESLFTSYTEMVSELEQAYPQIRLIHLTVPLRTFETGIKGLAKRILGKDKSIPENRARNLYNRFVVNRFGSSEALFDLAALESTNPDGTREFRTRKGEKIYGLSPYLSNDGGHLNEKGRKFIASSLLLFISEQDLN